MSSKVISSEVADDTNQKLASGLNAVQERIDRIVGNPLTLPAWKDAGKIDRGFPAQYQEINDPPISEKARVYNRVRGFYGEKLPESPTVAMTFGDSDVEAWRKKEKMVEQIRFDFWLSQHYDPFRDPAQANWLQSVYPEYFEARVEENKALHELQAQFNTLMIRGPKSKEDLYLLFRVENDPMLRQRVSVGPAGITQASDGGDYVGGLFSRSRYNRKQISELGT